MRAHIRRYSLVRGRLLILGISPSYSMISSLLPLTGRPRPTVLSLAPTIAMPTYGIYSPTPTRGSLLGSPPWFSYA